MAESQKIEIKSVKHTFTPEERNNLGGDLARSIAGLRGIESEFDQVKASYKAKTAEQEARIDNFSTCLMNGFEMRLSKCVVVYNPKARQKHYFLETDWNAFEEARKNGKANGELAPVLTEEMTRDDFQSELIQAESKFDNREEIQLFQPTESDSGVLIVGRFASKWFSALRVRIGKLTMEERLDSEQRSFKHRPDAIAHAVKRVKEWSKEHLKEHAKGFEDSFKAVVEAHKERSE